MRIGLRVTALLLLACAHRPLSAEQSEEAERRGPVCLEAMDRRVTERTEGFRVIVEVHRTWVCGSRPDPPVERVAEIALPAEPAGCPIGQLVVRTWDRGQASTVLQPKLWAALSKDHVAALMETLRGFAAGTAAFVVGCRPGDRADWLVVETLPVDDTHRVAFFVGDRLVSDRGQPHAGVPTSAPPGPPPEVEAAAPPPPAPLALVASGCPAPPLEATWVARQYWTSGLPGPDLTKRWALRLQGGSATLVYEEQALDKRQRELGWTCRASHTAQGVARQQKDGRLHLAFGGLGLWCRQRQLSVAPASATRLPLPPLQEDCARHRWKQPLRQRSAALDCVVEQDGLLWGEARVIFGAVPGLERLVLEADDCGDPLASLRAIAPDGSLAPAR